MKKYWIGAAALLLLAGCAGNTPDAPPAEIISPTEATFPPETTAAETETPQETTTGSSLAVTAKLTKTTSAKTTVTAETTAPPATSQELATSSGQADTLPPDAPQELPATTAPRTKKTAGWRNAYAEVLRESTAIKFSLCYVDGDDIPELILHETGGEYDDARIVSIYAYIDEEAVLLSARVSGEDSNRFCYVPYQNRITESDSRGGARVSFLYTIQEGAYCLEHMLACDDTAQTFSADGESIDAGTYQQMLDEWMSGSVTECGDWDVTEANIMQYVAW